MALHDILLSLTSLTFQNVIWSALAASVLYAVGLVVYRLYFHPLAKVPGPKLAAATFWYESYYVLWLRGKYVFKLPELHEKYGPIVRITPREVHINDPEYFDKVFTVGSKFCKDPYLYSGLPTKYNIFVQITNAAHRAKRGAFDPLFSRRVVLQQENTVQDQVRKLVNRVERCAVRNEPVDLHLALRSLSIDLASTFLFGHSTDLIDMPPQQENDHQVAMSGHMIYWMLNVHLYPHWIVPFVKRVMKNIPPSLQASSFQLKEHWMVFSREQILRLKRLPAEEYEKGSEYKPSVFKQIVAPGSETRAKWSDANLTEEAWAIIGAARETTGTCLTQTIYGIIANPTVYKRLADELQTAYPNIDDEMSYTTLESLPYLNAVVKEGLRKTNGAEARLPRLVPPSGFHYEDIFLPAGTAVSMAAACIHANESIFPEPEKFIPERWMGPEGKKRERYLVSFSRGSRVCLGKELALCEVHLAVAYLFRRFDLQFFDFDESDLEHRIVYFGGHHDETQRHLKVTAKPKVN